MSTHNCFTVVVAVNNDEIVKENLLSSPCFRTVKRHEFILQRGFPSAALAYNDAIARASNDLLVLVHQDMILPVEWLQQVTDSLEQLNQQDPEWGVVGCWGATNTGCHYGHIYSTGLGVLGKQFRDPVRVQTLDEVVLIYRRSTGLLFDSTLPHFHFYGTDICLRSARQGRACYVIPAFAVHNTQEIVRLPREFYQSYAHIRRVWKNQLPIYTSCTTISQFNAEVLKRQVEDGLRALLGLSRRPLERDKRPMELLQRAIKLRTGEVTT